MRLNEITNKVEALLENDPRTRNSDLILYREYIRSYHAYALEMPLVAFIEILANKANDIASIETVGRARRKIMERRSDLRASADIEAQRELREEEFKRYARS